MAVISDFVLARTVNVVTVTVYDEDGNQEALYTLRSDTPARRMGFDQPIITNIPAGGYVDINFAKSFDFVWGILSTSQNAVPARFQIYDESGTPQFQGSVGFEYVQIGASDSVPTNSLYNRPTHSGWYLRITNLSATASLKAQTVILGAFYSNQF